MLLIPHRLPHINVMFHVADSKLAVRHGTGRCDDAVWNLTHTDTSCDYTNTKHYICPVYILFWCMSSPACGQPQCCAAIIPENQIHNQPEPNHPSGSSTELWLGLWGRKDPLERQSTEVKWNNFQKIDHISCINPVPSPSLSSIRWLLWLAIYREESSLTLDVIDLGHCDY